MKRKKIIASVAAVSLLMGLTLTPVSAANLGDKQFVSNKPSCTDNNGNNAKDKGKCHKPNVSMTLLAKITGKTVDELEAQYPQKTSWQIAKALGKLDDLKKAYLENSKAAINALVDEKKISSEDGDAMYKDVEKRINAIDGVNIVISGHPSFKPNKTSSATA